MKNLKTIEGCLSVKDLGKAIKRHAELMVDYAEGSSFNSAYLNGMRNLCNLYERYNNELKRVEKRRAV